METIGTLSEQEKELIRTVVKPYREDVNKILKKINHDFRSSGIRIGSFDVAVAANHYNDEEMTIIVRCVVDNDNSDQERVDLALLNTSISAELENTLSIQNVIGEEIARGRRTDRDEALVYALDKQLEAFDRMRANIEKLSKILSQENEVTDGN